MFQTSFSDYLPNFSRFDSCRNPCNIFEASDTHCFPTFFRLVSDFFPKGELHVIRWNWKSFGEKVLSREYQIYCPMDINLAFRTKYKLDSTDFPACTHWAEVLYARQCMLPCLMLAEIKYHTKKKIRHENKVNMPWIIRKVYSHEGSPSGISPCWPFGQYLSFTSGIRLE